MKPIAFATLLMLAPLLAGAEWVRMGEDNQQITHYFDPSTIGKEGDLRTVRWLEEHRKHSPGGVLSTRSMLEFDCLQERRRTLAFSSHSELWAKGRTVGSGHRPSDWEAVAADTFAGEFRKLVCSR